MGRHGCPIRGNVVRLNYDPDACKGAMARFCEIMGSEASAVSMAGGRFPRKGEYSQSVYQLSGVYFWNGAIVTHGVSSSKYGVNGVECGIEMQKDNMASLKKLVDRLESEMQVKFRKRTVSRA